MTRLDKVLLVMVLIAAIVSLYGVAINDETLTEQRATLDSLQAQIKSVSKQVDKQQEFINGIDTLYVTEIVGVVGK